MRFVSPARKVCATRNCVCFGVSRNLEPEPPSLSSAEISPGKTRFCWRRRGWAAVVSIINLKFSAAAAAMVGEEIERTKQLEMAHCARAHHCTAPAIWIEPTTTTTTNHRGREREGESRE